MRIKKLELKNFRGFEDLTIDFPEGESGLAVFVGVNGSGTTSVLEGVQVFLHEYLYQLLYKNEYAIFGINETQPPYRNSDIRNGYKNYNISVYWNSNKVEFDANIHWEFNAGLPVIKPTIENYRTSLRNEPAIISYYAIKRSIETPTLKAGNLDLNPWYAYKNCLDGKAGFTDFFQWFRNSEDFENRKRLRENENFRHSGLEAVRIAIKNFLVNVSSPFVETTNFGEELFIEKDSIKFSLSQLSEGEKSVIVLVSDIARRLAIANPNLQQPRLGHGIVLIDEIEQHLHPAWQRTIIPNLRRTFPNIQFILTTHSPQVISTLKRENVFILDNFQLVPETPHTYGRDSNSILYDIFGVEKRPAEAKQEFAKLYRLMDDPAKVSETADLLRDAEAKYGYYDEEVVRARGQFQFLNEA